MVRTPLCLYKVQFAFVSVRSFLSQFVPTLWWTCSPRRSGRSSPFLSPMTLRNFTHRAHIFISSPGTCPQLKPNVKAQSDASWGKQPGRGRRRIISGGGGGGKGREEPGVDPFWCTFPPPPPAPRRTLSLVTPCTPFRFFRSSPPPLQVSPRKGGYRAL